MGIISKGVSKAIGGIVEACITDSYPCVIYGKLIDDTARNIAKHITESAPQQENLIWALKLNIINCHKNSFAVLNRNLQLCVSHRTFKREKHRFVCDIARQIGLMA